ncbi:MAG: hypothetical protein JWO38_7271 [Gemmataceae bacterium]|nr:hypothetical protein [Gemmataceae bacterium]
MRRFTLVAAYLLCLTAIGCVEGEQVFTLNPDGSGKVKIDVVTAPPIEPFGPQGKPGEDETIDGLLRKTIRPLLTAPGVTAWKDVTAEFVPDGRLKFVGTAYFKKLDDLDLKINPLLGSQFGLGTGPDGSLTLARKKKSKAGNAPDNPGFLLGTGKKTPEELAKMPDEQLDAYIMKERVGYQSAKPFVLAMLTDAKVKTTFILPGEPGSVSGFKTDGQKVYFQLDGNKAITGINKIYALDNAALRKVYRSKEEAAALVEAMIGFAPDDSAKATVAKPTGPQFDYDKEVKEAHAAYPELRKKFQLGDDVRLPVGSVPFPKGPLPK